MAFCLQLVGAEAVWGSPSSTPTQRLGVLVDLTVPIVPREERVVEEIGGVWNAHTYPLEVHHPDYEIRGVLRVPMDVYTLIDEGFLVSTNLFDSSTVERSLLIYSKLRGSPSTSKVVEIRFPKVKMWMEGTFRLQEIEGTLLRFIPIKAQSWIDASRTTPMEIEVYPG